MFLTRLAEVHLYPFADKVRHGVVRLSLKTYTEAQRLSKHNRRRIDTQCEHSFADTPACSIPSLPA